MHVYYNKYLLCQSRRAYKAMEEGDIMNNVAKTGQASSPALLLKLLCHCKGLRKNKFESLREP